jgi:hypothetical protein
MKTLPLFGMVLGLSGLCNVWRSAQALWYLPAWVAHALAVLAMGSAVLSWSLLRRELSASPLGLWRGAIILLREPLAALLTCCLWCCVPMLRTLRRRCSPSQDWGK